MNWFSKLKWLLGIGLVFLLILMTNLADRRSFNTVRNSLETIYDDRLVAQDLLYNLLDQLFLLELAYARPGSAEAARAAGGARQRIVTLLDTYGETRLTKSEEDMLGRLSDQIARLQSLDKAPAPDLPALHNQMADIRVTLAKLTDIQLAQGRAEVHTGRRAIGTADLFSRIEIIALIVIAVVFQVVVLASPRPTARREGDGREVR